MAKPKPIPDTLRELWELLQAYARQETIEPLKPLGRYSGYGVAGMALISISVVFFAMSGLRALQSQTDLFEGPWSFVPYLIVAVVLGIITALGLSRISKGQRGAQAAGGTEATDSPTRARP